MTELTGFAEACYNYNSIQELEHAVHETPDATDMAEWGLTEEEWRSSIKEALMSKIHDLRARQLQHRVEGHLGNIHGEIWK